MQSGTLRLRRLLTVGSATVALAAGMVTPAFAGGSYPEPPKKGELEVCKEVKGKKDYDDKFKFRVRQKDEYGDAYVFFLKDGECKKIEVEEGSYKVRETQLPDKCELDDIKVRPRDAVEKIDYHKRFVIVEVEKKDKVKVTFVNKCKKKDHDDDDY